MFDGRLVTLLKVILVTGKPPTDEGTTKVNTCEKFCPLSAQGTLDEVGEIPEDTAGFGVQVVCEKI